MAENGCHLSLTVKYDAIGERFQPGKVTAVYRLDRERESALLPKGFKMVVVVMMTSAACGLLCCSFQEDLQHLAQHRLVHDDDRAGAL